MLLAEFSKAEQLAPEYIAKLKEKIHEAIAQFDKGDLRWADDKEKIGIICSVRTTS